jgi:hypothetical protein
MLWMQGLPLAEVQGVAVCMLVATLCGSVVALTYRVTPRFRGASSLPLLGVALVLLPLIVAVIMMVVGNDMARAVGMVGAVSLIRFRIAIKSIYDILFLFLALAVGMAVGFDMYGVGMTGSVVVCGIAWGLHKYYARRYSPRLYVSVWVCYLPNTLHEPLFSVYCNDYQVVKRKYMRGKGVYEAEYWVYLKEGDGVDGLVGALEVLEGVLEVEVVFPS